MPSTLDLPALIRPRRSGDERGWFAETYNAKRFADVGIRDTFVQDNHSFSARKGTLRGLHYQREPHTQSKLVCCVVGAVWDVAVDLRTSSPTRGRWVAARLSAEEGEQLYVPEGFAHGFVTLHDNVHVKYKVSQFYAPDAEGALRWDDPDLGITWPLDGVAPTLSIKDAVAERLFTITSEFKYDGNPLSDLLEFTL